jgi:copper homeostasis protein
LIDYAIVLLRMKRISIEVCVDSVASAIAAERGGADRIELCSNLREGGTTPTAGMIEVVRSRISLPVHVMIRPRSGDFCYSDDEFEIMRRDVLNAQKTSAHGVVLGILTPDSTIGALRTSELVQLARPLSVTFHRAFDFSSDLSAALEAVISAGADRILTSGGKQTAVEAQSILANLVQAAKGRITILACGGINANNAATIIRDTGVNEIHVGLRRPVSDFSNRKSHPPALSLSPGAGSESEVQRYEVREEDVRELRSRVDAA